MQDATILLALRDSEVAGMLRARLRAAGLPVRECPDIELACAELRAGRAQVAVADLALIGAVGLEVLRRANASTAAPCVLVTGARSSEEIIAALRAGAQDCVLSTCGAEELAARVQTLLAARSAGADAMDHSDRLGDEISRKTALLALLNGFVRELNEARDAERVYDLVVDSVRRATGCRRISLMRFDPRSARLVCKRAQGMDPEIAEQLSVPADSGVAGRVFTTGSTVVARPGSADGRHAERYASDAFCSTPLVSTYLTSREVRLGVLNATDKPDGAAFTDDEVDAMCSIAVSAAIALHNLEHEQTLKNAIRALLRTVGRLSEYRDEETGLHIERVSEYATVLATRMARLRKYAGIITPQFIEELHQAAPLHDVGKVAIPDEILTKPGRLTDEEFQIMKTHTTIGRHTLKLALEETGPVPLLNMCVDIAYCHHERWDGRGYPRGIAGDAIPLAARIVGLVDAYDAITSQRCYKKAVPHAKAVEIIRSEAGGHFDPDAVAAFLDAADDFDRIRIAMADSADLATATVQTLSD